MKKNVDTKILETAGKLFAQDGFANFNIRSVAKKLKVAPSLIYYYFKNEDELLLSMFHFLNTKLGRKRADLPQCLSAKEMLKQRISFQIENQESIVAILKYYLNYRPSFPKFKAGFLPDKSALHIEEVLQFGIATGEFLIDNVEDDAKVITHAINGYLLEFYPYMPTLREKKILIEKIYSFVNRAIGAKQL